MTNQNDIKVINAWIKGEYKALKRANVSQSTDGEVLYSYGHWFEIGRLVRHPVTGAEHSFAILNGDRFSHSTGRHQADVRWALQQEAIESVIIPFAALTAAGVVINTVRPAHVEPERYEVISHRADQPPAGMDIEGAQRDIDNGTSVRFGEDWLNRSGTFRDGRIAQVVGYLHQTGDLRWFTQAVIKNNDGSYQWHTNRHWLGDCVFTATVSRNGRNGRDDVPFISSFDRQETRTLYFLSELPRYAVNIDDALEALKPESVATAEMMGRTCTRQGDMFGIPMTGLTKRDIRKMGAEFIKRTVDFNWSGWAQQQLLQRDRLQIIAAEVGPEPAMDWESRASHNAWLEIIGAKYNERFATGDNPSSRMTHGRAVQTGLRYRPDIWERRRARDVAAEPIYGTAHTASEVAVLPDGTTLARGSLYHEPSILGETRTADHARRRLGDGKTFHVIVRNTVPLQETR